MWNTHKFSIGDRVIYIGYGNISKHHIICEIKFEANCDGVAYYEYSTNKGTGFLEEDFKLFRKASKASIKEVIKDLVLEAWNRSDDSL